MKLPAAPHCGRSPYAALLYRRLDTLTYRPFLGALLLLLLNLSCAAAADDDAATEQRPRNVILFVADGAGSAHFTMARMLARHLGLRSHLFLDPYHVGSVQTHSARERVTDSASSATAYATGYKTYNGAISVDTLRRPLAAAARPVRARPRRAVVGWTTSGHTAADVNLYAYGPGSQALRGNVDNTQVGAHLFEMLELEIGRPAETP